MTIKKEFTTTRRASVREIGSTMTKQMLAAKFSNALAAIGPALEMRAAIKTIDLVVEAIAEHFTKGGHQVTIRGFGTFRVVRRKEFTTKDPNSNRRIRVPSIRGIAFKPSREILARIN